MQITPAIHALRHPFKVPVGPGIALDRFVYSYILAGEMITLIDTGVAGCGKKIFEYVRTIGRDPREVSLIILTHAHPDHIGAAREIQKVTGCTVMAHPAERRWIEDVELQNRERPVPGFATLVGGSVRVDHEITDGDGIDPDGTGEYEIQVFDTPGHSAGSVSLLVPAERALFCGDAVPVPGDLPVYDDPRESKQSVKKLLGIRGVEVLLSSWDDPRQGGDVAAQMEKSLAYLERVDAAVLRISAEGGNDPMDCAKRVAALLGIPLQAVTPMLARTFEAHFR